MLHIIIVLDKSESMETNKSQTIASLNSFINNQKQLNPVSEVPVFFSLVTFSDSHTTVINKIPIQEAPTVSLEDYNPDGMTALCDAIGYVITSMIVDNTKTICCVISDGEENSSKYFTRGAVSDLISSRGDSLEMVYIGSNQDAIKTGFNMGIINDDACLTYEDDDMEWVFECLGSKISHVRSGDADKVTFTKADRKIINTSFNFNDEYEEENDDDDECVFETLG